MFLSNTQNFKRSAWLAARILRVQSLLIYSSIGVTLLTPKSIQAQNGPTDFPELIITKIPGGPLLGKPILLTDTNSMPLITEGYGTCAPAYWDWDGDGLKDLLVGEFGSGTESGRYVGNFMRVYLNSGTKDRPEFTGDFNYAWPPLNTATNGTPYSVSQFCCVGFTPQFIDLDGDGLTDLTSGQYFGEVILFRGTEKSFLRGEPLQQEGNPWDKPKNYKEHSNYWLYSSVSFGDFTSDGKPDMIVGGRAIRISKNVSNSSQPKFARREFLLDINGKPLKVYDYTKEELARKYDLYTAGDYKISPVVVDWDNDGVLDLLVTNSYNHKGMAAIDFFRGKKIDGEYRFEPAVPLFVTKNNEKSLPGISPFVSVIDWNQDGIHDLLIGVSVVTLHNKFSSEFSWNWEEDMGIKGLTKDPALLKGKNSEDTMEWIMQEVKLPKKISKEDFLTMRHLGYVYLMLGNKEGK